jgi:Protein of unknown function (DUF4065)
LEYQFQYDQDAATAAFLYVAHRLPEADFHRVGKVLYFADKLHMQSFGRFITNDTYKAYQFGPLPEITYTTWNAVRYHLPQAPREAPFEVQMINGKPVIVPRAEPDLTNLSVTDRECLDESLAKHSHLRFFALSDLSHDTAWQAARGRLDWTMRLEEIVQTLPNADEVLSFLRGDQLYT